MHLAGITVHCCLKNMIHKTKEEKQGKKNGI